MIIDTDTALVLIAAGVGVTLILVYRLSSRMDQIAAKFDGQENWEHDDSIDNQVSASLESYVKRRDQLRAEKRDIPGIDQWAIATSSGDWEQNLITGADKFRGLIVEAYGSNPDTHFVEREAQKVPMDYHLAHDLVSFAHLTKDLSLKEIEWHIKKVELLGSKQKRQKNFGLIASEESELRELERGIEEIRSHLRAAKNLLLESFRLARKGGKSE